MKGQGVRPVFDRLFRTHGLSRAIRTDNGSRCDTQPAAAFSIY